MNDKLANEHCSTPLFVDFPSDFLMLEHPDELLRLEAQKASVILETRNDRIKCDFQCATPKAADDLVTKIRTNALWRIGLGKDGVKQVRCQFESGEARCLGLSVKDKAAMAKTHEQVNAETWMKRNPPSEGIYYVVRYHDHQTANNN